MNPADFSALISNLLTAIYTALGIIATLCGAAIWLLSQRFVSKHRLGEILKEKETEAAALAARVTAAEMKLMLIENPMKGIADGITAMQKQLSDLKDQFAGLDKKIAVHEALRKQGDE